jgi:hypothetical protein
MHDRTPKAEFNLRISETDNQIRILFTETLMQSQPKHSAIESPTFLSKEEKRHAVRCLMQAMSRVIQSYVWPEHTESYKEVVTPHGTRYDLEFNPDGTVKYLK